MKFDTRAARALVPGQHLTVEGAQGLRLECSAKCRAWTYRFRSPVDGRMRQIKIGEWPAMSASQAGVEWERLRSERESGRDPAQEKRAARKAAPDVVSSSDLTVGRLLDLWIPVAVSTKKAKGAAELRRTIKAGVPERLRSMRPDAVTRSVAYDLISGLSSTPVQAQALRRELGAAWEWGHDSGKIGDDVPNWWRQILRGKLKSKGRKINGQHVGTTKRALSLDEVVHVIHMLPHVSRLVADLLTMYLWSGCRGAEIVQMEGRELSERGGVLWWTIPKAKLKMGGHELAADLPVPLLGRARALVLARRDMWGEGYLFPTIGGVGAGHTEQKTVGVAVWHHRPDNETRPDCVRARWQIPHWTPHDLRRTVRTHLARLGCIPEIAEALIGHIDTEEDVYDRWDYAPERLEWITKLTDLWESSAAR